MKKSIKLIFVLLLLAAVIGTAVCRVHDTKPSPAPAPQKISAEEAKRIMDSGEQYFLLDVRTQEEFDAQHIPGAVCIPDSELSSRSGELPQERDTLILVYCRSGRRSALSAEVLAGLGYTAVRDFGGIIDWQYETVEEAVVSEDSSGEHVHHWVDFDCNYQQCSCGLQKRYSDPAPDMPPSPTPHPLIEPVLSDCTIDPSFFEPASEQGQLITIDYETRDYMNAPSIVYEKSMTVYLPYGYDETKQYDVLFLAHISGGGENWWLNSIHYFEDPERGTQELYIPTMLDNMIERGMCPQVIVIGLNCYISSDEALYHNSKRDYYQFPREFREDIMPAVQSNLSVYDSREHYGFLGASFGAYVDYICVLTDCFDLVGWHCQTGGGTVYADTLRNAWSNIGALDEPLCGFYICEGTRDDLAPVMEGIYNMQQFDTFSYTLIEGCGHEYREWDIALYNALQIFFR